MSWHFSQALVAAYSADTCSAGAPSAPLSGSPIPQAFLCSDRMTAFSRLSRFGMTFKPLTEDLGADVLMWFLAGFPAKTSAQLERAQELTAPEAVCGSTWHGSLARFDRATSSWRTPQCSLLEGLDEFSETWPRWGMMQGGECSAQSMPAHLTSESESGSEPNGETFFHTPNTGGLDGGSNSRRALRRRMMVPTPVASLGGFNKSPGENSKVRPGLEMMARHNLWPTPTVCGNYNRKGASATSGDGLETAVKMWPTPQASDNRDRGNLSDPCIQRRIELGKQVNLSMAVKETANGGSLNPTWVEWLMGWPLGWTDLKPLEMDKFQQWLVSHGKHLVENQSK